MEGRKNCPQVPIAHWSKQLGRSVSSGQTGEGKSDCPRCVRKGAREGGKLQFCRETGRLVRAGLSKSRYAMGGVLGLPKGTPLFKKNYLFI